MDKSGEHFQEAKKFIEEILEKCKDKRYIYRGITQVHQEGEKDRVSSGLYRKYKTSVFEKYPGYSFPARLEEEIVERVRGHFPINSSIIEILTDLRHLGSEQTTLIDFSHNMYIALFFACNGNFDKDGELLLLDTERIREAKEISYPSDNNELIIKPAPSQSSNNRVIFQSSIFVHAPLGYIKGEYILSSPVQKEWKKPILDMLRRYHDIHSGTVYNDLFGFIGNEKNYESALVELYIGHGALEKKEYEEAIEQYTKAIELKPDFANAYVNRANAKGFLGRHKETIEDFTKAIKLEPDSDSIYQLRGIVRRELGDKEGAVRDFTEAIKLKSDAKTYISRGIARKNLGDNEGAAQDFTQAIKLNPDYAEAYTWRAGAKYILGHHEEAFNDCDQAIKLKPDFADAYFQRADMKHTLGRHEEAIEDFTKAIELKPDFAYAYYFRGAAKKSLGDNEGADQDFTKAIELKPDLRDFQIRNDKI